MPKTVVLAFSGGLDTSYCAVRLREDGHRVVSYYVHTGGAHESVADGIAARAEKLGVAEHHTFEAGTALFDEIVVPFLTGAARRQGRYPILCADRYLICRHGAELAAATRADAVAHGCTGMGNDQVRFDVSFGALSRLPILAPIRDIQDKENVRAYEADFLRTRGFNVPVRATRYSVNENLLGVTMSGGAIDAWAAPEADARAITAAPGDWPRTPLRVRISFEAGVPVAIDGVSMAGPDLLDGLNQRFGAYGVGYDLYTGDTLVGLKGRIVFEAPGLAALEAAATALGEAVSTAAQNGFRRTVGEAWADLVYDGRFFDPCRDDLEAYLRSARQRMTGTVDVETHGGSVNAVAITSPYILQRSDAVYAQRAAWSGIAAEGFTRLSGQSTQLWHRVGGGTQ